MLDFMRKNANSGIMMVIFGVIIFVFAINFGPWAGRSTSEKPYAAIVNSDSIPMSNFRIAFANQINRFKQFRQDYDQQQAEKDGMVGLILNQMIRNELLYQTGKKYNFVVPARVLALQIKDRVFAPDESFSKDEYQKRIEGFLQMSIPQFEEQVTKDIVSETTTNLILSSVNPTEKQIEDTYKEQNTKLAIDYIKINPKFFAVKEGSISKEKVLEFANNQKEQIESYYKENLSSYQKGQQVKASHILVKIEENDTEKQTSQKRKRAQEVLAKVQEGGDFSALAMEYSDDTGTKFQGGDLGYFTFETMVEDFSKAAFALEKNQVSDIVKSPFGFHIIKVMDKKEAINKSLEDVSEEIAQKLVELELQKDKAKSYGQKALALLSKGAKLSDISMMNLVNKKREMPVKPDSPFSPMADESGEFNLASSYIPKLGMSEEVAAAAAKLQVDQTANELIESKNSFYAIRLKEKKEADMEKLAEKKSSIKSRLTSQMQNNYMEQYAAFLKSNAKIVINDTLKDKMTLQ